MIIETFWQDLRYGARGLRKSAGFTVVAVATLALGIGVNAVIFSIVNAVILRPLPYPNPRQLVMVWETDTNRNVARGATPPADFLDWRAQNHVFQSIAAIQYARCDLRGTNGPRELGCARVSPNFFDLLGVKPQLGRIFLPEEEQFGHGGVVILSHEIWAETFGADKEVVGKTILVTDKPYTVVGVLPAGFNLYAKSRDFGLWMPLSFAPQEIRRDNPSLIIFARLKQGVAVAQAGADIEAIMDRLGKEYPLTNQGVGSLVSPMKYELTYMQREPLFVLLGAVGLVLLIACANVSSLLLSRAAARRREISIRAALGARRWRLLRQMLTESILLGLAGGGAGLLLALAGLLILPLILPPPGAAGELPFAHAIGLNWTVLSVAIVVALLTGVLFGLVPAFQSSRADLNDSLKETGRSSTGGRESRLARNGLVIAEVGIALVLLIGAVTLIRGFRDLLGESPGFNPKNVLSMQILLPEAHYPNLALARVFFQQTVESVRSLPGVESASAINFLPLSGWTDFADLDIQGRPSSPHLKLNANYRVIDFGYFESMQIPLLRGRSFVPADGEGSLPVAIVNQTLAQDYWHGEDPIGQRIRIHIPQSKDSPWRAGGNDNWITIVGVVGNIQNREWGGGPIRELYLPYLQEPSRLMALVVRASGFPHSLAGPIRQIVASEDKLQPITGIETMDEIISQLASPQALDSTLLGFFAALALTLAAIGIYGVISYSVEQRTHEIGIRLALGARPRDVLALVVRQGLLVAAIGAGLGLVAAYAVTRFLAASFFGIHSMDFKATGVAVVVLLLVAVIACYIPARRAARVDPIQALRYE